MRRFLLTSMIALLPGLAWAQSDGNTPPAAPASAGFHGGEPGGFHGGWGKDHHGMGGEEMLLKFYAANTSHDGHLTLAQAQKAGFTPVVEHFADIDVKKHGYVTFYDIEAWRLDDFAKHLEQRADALRAED